MGKKSRIREYVDQQVLDRADTRASDLEAELEDEKRRSLRLQQQLMNETSLRCRAERLADYRSDQIDELKEEKAELEKKISERTRRSPRTSQSRERVGTGGTVPDGPQRVDGSPAPVRKSRAKPADLSGDAGETGPAKKPGGSRKRGKVK